MGPACVDVAGNFSAEADDPQRWSGMWRYVVSLQLVCNFMMLMIDKELESKIGMEHVILRSSIKTIL